MERLDYVSNDDALLRVQRYCLQDGKTAGVQMIRVCNAAGLELHLAVDRALDIAELRFQGVSLGYFSATGITHPSYYEPGKYGWLRSFYGGFLTTCGLDQVGEPCSFGEEEYGLHGRISNCPAEQVCAETHRENHYVIGTVQGAIRQTKQQGEAFLLRRTYEFREDSTAFAFTDVIENQCAKPLPLQLLYHFNLGYPFLSPELEMELPPAEILPADEASKGRCKEYADCTDTRELTLLHKLLKRAPKTSLVLKNKGIRLKLIFDGEQLPILAQWRYLQPREYVMAFEPANAHLQGVAREAENGTLEYLQPRERKTCRFHIELSRE